MKKITDKAGKHFNTYRSPEGNDAEVNYEPVEAEEKQETADKEKLEPNYCREVKMMTNDPPAQVVSIFINGEEWVKKQPSDQEELWEEIWTTLPSHALMTSEDLANWAKEKYRIERKS